MAKSLVLGNGSMLVCLDAFGQVNDWYYPYVGLENHISSGMVHKIGVFVDDTFSWLSDEGWDIRIAYHHGTMASDIVAKHAGLSLELCFSDVVYNEHPVFVRHITVQNTARHRREIKVFFNQQFRISESAYGDTAYFSPQERAIVHYKGKRWFLIAGKANDELLDDFSIGLLGIEGKEGTWRDAEDGSLSHNAIEHGSVDSVLGCRLLVGSNTHKSVSYWVAVGKKFSEVTKLHDMVQKKTPEHIVTTTKHYWEAWANTRPFSFYGLQERVVEQFKTSLFVMASHADRRGGIIASGDSDILQGGRDTYSYVWPRDGVFASLAFDKAGYAEVSKRFYAFCNKVITKDGYLLHKYRPDTSLGSSWHPWIQKGQAQLPIQEDETALVLIGLFEHYAKTRDIEFIEKLYNSLIQPTAEFMLQHRDEKTGLPLATFGLWEEQFATTCFTSCATAAALKAASSFANELGKTLSAGRYAAGADSMREAIVKHFYNEEKGYFIKLLHISHGKIQEKDERLDASSTYGVFRFGILPHTNKKLESAIEQTNTLLRVGEHGIARYQGDRYFAQDAQMPGNAWILTSLWSIEYAIAQATNEEELNIVAEKLSWICDRAYKAGMLSEQLYPHTNTPLSVVPLTWSHAGFVLTIVAYLEKLEELGICEACYPLNN